jgi:hypothetical protein
MYTYQLYIYIYVYIYINRRDDDGRPAPATRVRTRVRTRIRTDPDRYPCEYNLNSNCPSLACNCHSAVLALLISRSCSRYISISHAPRVQAHDKLKQNVHVLMIDINTMAKQHNARIMTRVRARAQHKHYKYQFDERNCASTHCTLATTRSPPLSLSLTPWLAFYTAAPFTMSV